MISDSLTIFALNPRQHRPAVRRRCFDRLTSRSRRTTSLGRSRCRDDTRASSDLSPASFRRAHIDDPARSNVSRQLRRRVHGVARRSNDRHPLHVASSCVDRVDHPRTDEVRLKLEKIISVQSSHCWAKLTSDLIKRVNVSVAPTRRVTVETVGRMTSYIYDVIIGLMI